MNTAYLLLGANKHDKHQKVAEALERLALQAGTIVRSSSLYRTAAWGNTDQPEFVNQVVCLETALSPLDLLHCILKIEEQLGRIRTGEKWQERVIDIDILFYNNDITDLHELQIPHPHLHERNFVLAPLSEIAPDLMHPLLNKRVHELLAGCSDQLGVSKSAQQ